MNNKKSVRLNRLEKVMIDDRNMTKEEIMDYVINDIKPGQKHKDENKKEENININEHYRSNSRYVNKN